MSPHRAARRGAANPPTEKDLRELLAVAGDAAEELGVPRLAEHPVGDLQREWLSGGTDDVTREWTIGYDLDTGGHEFERPEPELVAALRAAGTEDAGCFIVWDSPDLGYVTGGDAVPRGTWPDVLFIAPNSGHYRRAVFPDEYRYLDSVYRKIGEGDLRETDHDCWCVGAQEAPDIDVDEIRRCDRCGGDGYVNSPGGEYAIYTRVDEERGQRR